MNLNNDIDDGDRDDDHDNLRLNDIDLKNIPHSKEHEI